MALTQNDIRRIEQLIREEVRGILGLFLSETRIEKVDEGGDPIADVVQLDPDNDVAEPVSRYEGWGDVATPETDGAALMFHTGFQGVELPRSMPRYRPSGDFTKRGGRALYSSEAGTLVGLHGKGSATPGRVEVNSGGTGAAQEDVRVNGGTAKVARDGDPVGFLMWVISASMAGPVVTAVSWSKVRPLPPFVTPPVPGVPGSYYLPLSITDGAPHFTG